MDSQPENNPQAKTIRFNSDSFTIITADNTVHSFAYDVSPRLFYATPQERATGQIMPSGQGIEWESLDEHLSVAGLIAGKVSTESWPSVHQWLTAQKEPA